MHSHRTAALALWAALVVTAPARAADGNAIRALDVAERDGAVEIAIQGSRPPSYTVFRLQDPPRLVVDLSGADVSGIASPVAVGKGGVVSVSAAQFADERASVGRVTVALDASRSYEVVPRGDAVVVRVMGEGARASSPIATPPSTAAPTSTATPTSTSISTPTPTAAPTATSADPHLVARRVDEGRAARPAHALRGVKATADGLVLLTDGDVGTFEVIELRDPARLAIDLHGVDKAPKAPAKTKGAFAQVRFGRNGDTVRAVLDAAGTLPRYEVKRIPGGLAIATSTSTATATATATSTPTSTATAPRPALDIEPSRYIVDASR